METPSATSTPEPGRSRQSLSALGDALRTLHRVLVARSRYDFERERHAVLNRAELLQLLTSDPRFAWLRSLSELIVDLDVFLKTDPAPTDDDASALGAELQRLLAPASAAGTESDFAAHYWPYVQDDGQVALAHGEVLQALVRLPDVRDVDEAQIMHERHRWTEVRRHQR